MRMRRKCFVALSLICVLLFGNVIIAYDEPSELDIFTDGFKYRVNSDGNKTCTIYGYESDIYTNIIPKELDGYIVTRIGDGAFKNATQLTGEVTIPNTVISIGNDTFSGCTLMTQVKFGDSLISIGDSAFSGCTSLEKVDFKNIQSIGNEAFKDCNGFEYTEITLPNSLNYIGSLAFANTNIEKIIFTTKKAPTVENDTFEGYTGKIIIPYDCDDYIGSAWSGAKIDGIELVGDLDGNGMVNANDAAVALDLYKYGNATEEDMKIADIDRDGKINANDAALILDIYKYGK